MTQPLARPVVLIAEELSPATIEALGPDFEIRSCNGADRAELLPAIADVDAILVRSATKVDAEALAAARRLKVGARAGVGLDSVDGTRWTAGTRLTRTLPGRQTLTAGVEFIDNVRQTDVGMLKGMVDAEAPNGTLQWQPTPVSAEKYGAEIGLWQQQGRTVVFVAADGRAAGPESGLRPGGRLAVEPVGATPQPCGLVQPHVENTDLVAVSDFSPGSSVFTIDLTVDCSILSYSDDGGESWIDVTRGLPSDYGYALAVDPGDPDRAFVVPEASSHMRTVVDGRLRVYRTGDAGASWHAMERGLPQRDAWVGVLREGLGSAAAAAGDSDGDGASCSVYLGTSSGHVFASPDAGESWHEIAAFLPGVLCIAAMSS